MTQMILVLREEVTCLIFLSFFLITSAQYSLGKDRKPFLRLVIFAIIHVTFDIITILQVNHYISASPFVVNLSHVIFYVSAMLMIGEVFSYIARHCTRDNGKLATRFGYGLSAIYCIAAIFLPISYS